MCVCGSDHGSESTPSLRPLRAHVLVVRSRSLPPRFMTMTETQSGQMHRFDSQPRRRR